MIKKKLISRVIVFILTIVLMFTFIPPNLIASAFNGVGGGQSGNGQGGGGTGNNDSLYNQEVGLRFSLVTLKDGKRTVVETKYTGRYFIDIWCDSDKINLNYMYHEVTDYTRYPTASGTGAEYGTIMKGKASSISKTVNDWLKSQYSSYGVTANYNLGSVLFDGPVFKNNKRVDAVFNEWLSGGKNKFGVIGTKFYD